ncbi:hypothetical protein Q0Z83_046570 [Actinoplanes sichuanensis]|uniref:Tagaturonate reductase n=1 Tax=Actinoplanes sichuanensis TaxID=512349 RepID=A0ABW4AAZ4_9ACTN|nr:tagaturonate reductase [Actinoplanes sichuanensis]BEL06466.1 hypothetical protein Q0Z83_046570 [Actinoplanes sichuanensis]
MSLPTKILQIGAGNFLRGFADWMIQKGNDAGVLNHGVAVMRVTPRHDPQAVRITEGFDVVLDGTRDGVPFTETTRVDVVRQYAGAHDDWDACLAIIRQPDLRLVISNTTDAGIVYLDEDLTARPPASFPAKMAALLHERWRHFAGDPDRALSFLPCELIEDNGQVLRAAILRHARFEPAFERWVADHCRFYDTMVDRIVPGTVVPGGLDVRAEHYASWAIAGDDAIRHEFPLDRAGLPVEFLSDVRPYRQKKVSILNGAHTALAAVAPALGCRSVSEAMAHPVVGGYVRRLVTDEVLPALPGRPEDLQRYAVAILERIANPALDHRLADIALNATAKWQTRNLPIWRATGTAPLTTYALAALLTGYAGVLGDVPVRDDPDVVARIRATFDPADPQRWLAATLRTLAWDLSDPERDRLATQTAEQVRLLLDLGPEKAIAA